MSLAIKVEHLRKVYQKGKFDLHLVKKIILHRLRINQMSGSGDDLNQFDALNDISFDIPEGEAVGITGNNGAGKTTLLKIISRITAPTSGVVKIKGRVASLLDLAAGFHSDLTGRENIFLVGAFLGIKKSTLTEKLESIISFAELESHIDTPVKRYSAGMYLRLAFSVAINLEHEIILLDEVFAVGDVGFQEKCVQSINEIIKNKKKTVLLVSHDNSLIKKICSRMIVLEKGQLVGDYKL